MRRIHVGTGNPGKIKEYEAILATLGLELAMVNGPEPEEPAPDLEGNARLKAQAYAKLAGTLTLAEDAGLVVPSLGGLPGVVSARFSDCEVDTTTGRVLGYRPSGRSRHEIDEANRQRLLELLASSPEPARRAYFQVVVAAASPDGVVLFTARGEAHGTILHEPRGEGGFGYDALFAGDDTGGRSFAEVNAAEKNAVSHRRRALEQVRRWLAEASPEPGL
jgi:XTP/dITP diphosphohydrolase